MVDTPLVLGWRVTRTLEPQYWLKQGAKPGEHSDQDMVSVPAKTTAAHTAIIAQSGSGKSFFLGRIVEELLINTRARCLVFDPNADFYSVSEVEPDSLWEAASYDINKRQGKLPHERCRTEFAEQWAKVSTAVRTVMAIPNSATPVYLPLRLWPSSLPIELLAGDASPELRLGLFHWQALVRALVPLLVIRCHARSSRKALLTEIIEFFDKARHSGSSDGLRAILRAEFNSDILTSGAKRLRAIVARYDLSTGDLVPLFGENYELISAKVAQGLTNRLHNAAESAVRFCAADIVQWCLARVLAPDLTAILQLDGKLNSQHKRRRLEVIDLPSIPDRHSQLMAVGSTLADEWKSARSEWSEAIKRPATEDHRAPVFIIVDEAHNLMPVRARNAAQLAVREQFRTIVAEGRKYGLFLIVATQRPDKLDTVILGECENVALMRISGPAVLAKVKSALSLGDIPPRELESVLDFDQGRVILCGTWATAGPIELYVAARRTREGGRNLQADQWAKRPLPD
jgi:hypothetical protein